MKEQIEQLKKDIADAKARYAEAQQDIKRTQELPVPHQIMPARGFGPQQDFHRPYRHENMSTVMPISGILS